MSLHPDGQGLVTGATPSQYFDGRHGMDISARNQLRGKVTHVTPGAVMSEVTVDVGGQVVVALITKASVDRLGLEPGDAVTAIIKSTDVMIGK